MSIQVKELSEDLKKKIVKDLIFYPISYTKLGSRRIEQKGDPIVVFRKEKDYILLPYNYGNNLLGEKINFKKSYPKREFNFTKELRDYQEQVGEDILKMLKKESTCILSLAPGMGKTCMSIYTASKLNLATIILITSKTLLKSWKSTAEEFSDSKDIYIVGESKNHPEKIPDITICMEKRVSTLPLEWLDKFGLLVIDELHQWTSMLRSQIITCFEPLFVLGCTATPFRTDKTFGVVETICGKNTLVKISQKPFTVFKFMTKVSVPTKQNVRGELDWNHIVNQLCEHEERNNMIIKIVEQNLNRKILVMCARIEHAKFIQSKILEKNITCDILAGTKTKFKSTRVLVGTVSKCSTGMDYAMSCEDFDGEKLDMLIMAMSTKSLLLVEQIQGRVSRAENPIVFHMVDDIRPVKTHWTTASKWYKSRNGKIINIDAAEYMTNNTEPLIDNNKNDKIIISPEEEISSSMLEIFKEK